MHRQIVGNIREGQVRSRFHPVNPVRIAVARLKYMFEQNGFTPVYCPSLTFIEGVKNKRIEVNREDYQKHERSDFPLMLYNRTNLVTSRSTFGEKTFDIIGPMNSIGVANICEFTLNLLAVFNSIESLEEYEINYLLNMNTTENFDIEATLPPIGPLAELDEIDRKFCLDLEWGEISNLRTERLESSMYEFSLSSSVLVRCPFFCLSDPDQINKLDYAKLRFFWDEEMRNKESEWDASIEDPNLHVTTKFSEDRIETSYPYIKEEDPEYVKTDFADTHVSLYGFLPRHREKTYIDPNRIPIGSSVTEVTYSWNLNTTKYQNGNVSLIDIDGNSHESNESQIVVKYPNYGREFSDESPVKYSLSVYDKYSSSPSTVNSELHVIYPIHYGLILNPKKAIMECTNHLHLSSNVLYFSDSKYLSFGSEENKYFIYCYPSIFGEISNIEINPRIDFPISLIARQEIVIYRGRKSSPSPMEFLFYMSENKIDQPISFKIY